MAAEQAEKAMTLRLSALQWYGIEAIARAEGKSKSDVVREAVEAHIAARKADPEFQRRLRALIDQNDEALRSLLEPEPDREEQTDA